MARARHAKKEVESALTELTDAGWSVETTKSGHRWGVARCSEASRSGCQISIWSTPRSPGNHAKAIRRALDQCAHDQPENEEQA
ncbi:hypothetical protein [Ilumatobacter sp.]|uniref:hypothetical protein n=1 Tax=Ilumatobacter sp. TaxID=1967498 RepID=UPI0037526A1F